MARALPKKGKAKAAKAKAKGGRRAAAAKPATGA